MGDATVHVDDRPLRVVRADRKPVIDLPARADLAVIAEPGEPAPFRVTRHLGQPEAGVAKGGTEVRRQVSEGGLHRIRDSSRISAGRGDGGGGKAADEGRADRGVTGDALEQAGDAGRAVGTALATPVEEDLGEGVAGKEVGVGHLVVAEVTEGQTEDLGGEIPVKGPGLGIAGGVEVAERGKAQHADIEHRRERQREVGTDCHGRGHGHLARLQGRIVVTARRVALVEPAEAAGRIAGAGYDAAELTAKTGVGSHIDDVRVIEREVAENDRVAAVAVGRHAEHPGSLATRRA